jgi:hypothetical protein
MRISTERVSRAGAVVALLASAAFFAWYGLAIGRSWTAALPFYGGASLMWVVAAIGVHRRTVWGPSFAAGLSAVSIVTMLRAGLHPAVTVFLGVQVLLLAALATRAAATRDDREPLASERWRYAGLAFAAGIATPYLLLVGLFPGLSLGPSLLGLAGLALGVAGVSGAFRGRAWGLLAMVGAVPLLLAVPPAGWSCHAALHDRAGELASLGMVLGVIPWVGPVARRLRG